jgi:hypothetical protein
LNGLEAIAGVWGLSVDVSKRNEEVKISARKIKNAKSDLLKDLVQSNNLVLLYCWLVIEELGLVGLQESAALKVPDSFKVFGLEKPLSRILVDQGRSRGQARRELSLLRILSKHSHLLVDADSHNRFIKMERLFDDYDVREFIKVNLHKGTWFYHQESLQELLRWLLLVSVARTLREGVVSSKDQKRVFSQRLEFIRELEELSEMSGFDVEKLRALLSP